MHALHRGVCRVIDRSIFSLSTAEGRFDCMSYKVCPRCKNDCAVHHDSCPSCRFQEVIFPECNVSTRLVFFAEWLVGCRLSPTDVRDGMSCQDILKRVDLDFRASSIVKQRCTQGIDCPLVVGKAKLKKDLEQILNDCDGLDISSC